MVPSPQLFEIFMHISSQHIHSIKQEYANDDGFLLLKVYFFFFEGEEQIESTQNSSIHFVSFHTCTISFTTKSLTLVDKLCMLPANTIIVFFRGISPAHHKINTTLLWFNNSKIIQFFFLLQQLFSKQLTPSVRMRERNRQKFNFEL